MDNLQLSSIQQYEANIAKNTVSHITYVDETQFNDYIANVNQQLENLQDVK